MSKRIFTIRQDRYVRIKSILSYIEKKGPSSKSRLTRGLIMHYSRVSDCVDWLSNKERSILKQKDSPSYKPGKPEVFYEIIQPYWRKVIQLKNKNRKLMELKVRLAKAEKELKEKRKEIEAMKKQISKDEFIPPYGKVMNVVVDILNERRKK